MVNLFNSKLIISQIGNSLEGVTEGIKEKYKEVEKRFSEPNILKNSTLSDDSLHFFICRISNDLIKSPEGDYISPEIVDDKRSSIKDEGFLLGYDIETKKFVITPREECHKNPDIMHYGVYCFVHTSDRKYVLLQKRGETDLYAYKWTCPVSGHVDLGESFLEALAREYKEELEGTSSRYLRGVEEKGHIKVRNENEWELKKIYDVEIDSPEIYFRLSPEIHGFSFFKTSELCQMIEENPNDFTEGVVKAYQEFF